jgi:LPS export ABC transporter protein LptC
MILRRGLCLAALLFILSGCTRLSPPPPEGPPVEEFPEQELYDAEIKFFSNDRLQTVLTAGRVRKFQQRHVILLDSGVIVNFFDETGKHTTTLWADSGTANETTKAMEARGHVVAVSDSGERLETSVLRWDDKTRRVATDAAVKISTPTDTLYGIGFRSDQNLRNWTIDKPQGVTFRDLSRSAEPTAAIPQDTLRFDSIPPDTVPP